MWTVVLFVNTTLTLSRCLLGLIDMCACLEESLVSLCFRRAVVRRAGFSFRSLQTESARLVAVVYSAQLITCLFAALHSSIAA